MPARDRHADRDRAVCRDPELLALRASQAADELRRARSLREELGPTRRQGAITKSGSQHARRLLVEAAWHYRHPPRLGTRLKARQVDQPAQVIAIAWKAQQRLHQLWRRLDTKRRKRKTIVAAAVARHLGGFCWTIVTTNINEHPTT